MKRYEKYKPSGIEWIGEIPEHWKYLRLKWVTKFFYGESLKNEDREEGDVPVFGSNGIVGYHSKAITEAPCLIIGRKGSYGKINYSESPCFPIDTTYFIDRKVTKNDLRWLFYVLPVLKLDAYSKDSAVPGLSREEAYDNILPVPTIDEQSAIANYLNCKTAQIDDLIAKKQKLIDMLNEEKTAIINQAITKGLTPNAPMKDSGIPWLGEIPTHWEVVPMTKYLESIIDYRGRTPTKSNSGIFLVTARNIKNGTINYSLSEEYILEEEYYTTMRRGELEIGDVLFTTEAPLGEAANVDRTDVAVAQRIIKFRGKRGALNNYYLKHWIMTPTFQQNLYSYATGSTAIGIKASKLFNLKLLLPPVFEQEQIVAFVSDKTDKSNNTISRFGKEIGLLKEYRTALISEVVTGKVKVI